MLVTVSTIISDNGEILKDPFLVTNDIYGFNLLLDLIKDYDNDNLVIGVESTAIYHINFIRFFYNKGFNISVINPIITGKLRKTNIRPTKTDKIDSNNIVKSMIINGYSLFKQADMNSLELKQLSRFRKTKKEEVAKLKTMLVKCIDLVFPEYQFFFKSGIHSKTSYALLKTATTSNEIANLHLTRLTNILKSNSKGRFKQSKAVELKSLAKQSIGSCSPSLSIEIKQLILQNLNLLLFKLMKLKLKSRNCLMLLIRQ